jgi:ElaB/YqjD/DUF883 family membrane-anchored ribosome-binding protein
MGIALPKIQVGRFLRKSVAPLIPGGADVAERVNGVIKDVKAATASGTNIVDATKASITEANVQAEQRKYLTIALVLAAGLLLVYLARRR